MEITMSTGVKLKLKPPSSWAIDAVRRQVLADEPKPPKVFVEAKGREEENEADPDYQRAMQSYGLRSMERLYEAAILTGTEIISLPEGFVGPDDNAWHERLEALHIEVDKNASARYIQWVKYIAAPTREDWQDKLLPSILASAGTREADVAEAIDAFPSDEAGGADSGGGNNELHINGVGVRTDAPRSSSRLRRERGIEV